MARKIREKENESRFYCLKQSLVCPVDFLNQPDCENCRWHNDCQVCARKNTGICDTCSVKED